MNSSLWLAPAALAMAEVVARVVYRVRFALPFRSRRIGEYAYERIVEMVDPPLHYRLAKGVSVPRVSINSLGLRGPEPAPKGKRRRIMFLGESGVFGARLQEERHLWSIVLERMLAAAGHPGWEVLNAGFPGYNAFQLRVWWEQELRQAAPDILIISLGGNDISQVGVLGEAWYPGAPWPQDFIRAMRRRSPWWHKALAGSALWFLLRHRGSTARKGFAVSGGDALRCAPHSLEQLRAIVDDAHALGAHVAVAGFHPVCGRVHSPLEERRLDGIQSNWREHHEGLGRAMLDWSETFLREAPAMGAEPLDLAPVFWEHPRRFQLYYDVLHLNPEGHAVLAQALLGHLERLGWLKDGARPGA